MWRKWFAKTEQFITPDNQLDRAKLPRHVAIIMDGNGRWANNKGMPRSFGHHAGVEALRKIVRTASNLGIGVLTVYAFSTENWKRPHDEVSFLMDLFSSYLTKDIAELDANNVQIRFIGKIQELSPTLYRKFIEAQQQTSDNNGLVFNAAINYGGKSEIIDAVKQIVIDIESGSLTLDKLDESVLEQNLYTAGLPPVDLLIRPSGDYRISNFLLWQSAYAELWFTDLNWPDFTPEIFIQALTDFQQRERRFGGLKIK